MFAAVIIRFVLKASSIVKRYKENNQETLVISQKMYMYVIERCINDALTINWTLCRSPLIPTMLLGDRFLLCT